jgi:hypothetical protein
LEEKMSSDEKQYFYPNRWPRIILMSTEEIVGEKGVAALLNLAGLPEYIQNYPDDNMKKEFPFEDVGKLQQAYWDMYGPRGARVFATRAGRSRYEDRNARETYKSWARFLRQVLQHRQRPKSKR